MADCERSRTALLERFPKLAEVLAAAPSARPVCDGGAIVDLDLGSTRLYGTDGRELAARQVEAYLERPVRFYVTSVRGANTGSPVSARMLNFMYAACRRLRLTLDDLEVKPRYEGSYLVVLGLGLGYHLETLLERTRARHIIVIEPYADFLRQSLATLDWAALLERADREGCKVSLCVSNQPERMVSEIQAMFSAEGVPFIDGSYVFLHYPATELFSARDRLAEAVETLFIARGFFEDEILMLTNTLSNLAGSAFRLVDQALKPARPEPVLVVGSGPSIDQTIDQVKRLRDRAILISCGTGLKICLAHGLVPDYHTEIENGDWVYDALVRLRDVYGLGGITLAASLSVDPRVPGLFDDRILFFRDTVSGTRILAPPGCEIHGAVPTVANTAVRLGMGMGFSDFFLFGIDCGTKSEEKKHSSLAIYNESAQFKQYEDQMEMAYTYRGNFGGTVQADWVFNFSRAMLESLTTSYDIKVTNCSDGARIANAVPRLASSVNLPGPPLDRALVKARVRAVLRDCRPAELLAGRSFDTLRQEAERFRAGLLATLEAAMAEDPDFVAFWRRLSAFLSQAGTDYAGTSSVIRSSLQSMPKIGMFFVHRVREPETRQKLYRAFLEEYRLIADFMCDGLKTCLDELDQRFTPGLTEAEAHRAPQSPET